MSDFRPYDRARWFALLDVPDAIGRLGVDNVLYAPDLPPNDRRQYGVTPDVVRKVDPGDVHRTMHITLTVGVSVNGHLCLHDLTATQYAAAQAICERIGVLTDALRHPEGLIPLLGPIRVDMPTLQTETGVDDTGGERRPVFCTFCGARFIERGASECKRCMSGVTVVDDAVTFVAPKD